MSHGNTVVLNGFTQNPLHFSEKGVTGNLLVLSEKNVGMNPGIPSMEPCCQATGAAEWDTPPRPRGATRWS